jgi:hypothetical protein
MNCIVCVLVGYGWNGGGSYHNEEHPKHMNRISMKAVEVWDTFLQTFATDGKRLDKMDLQT